MASQIIRVSVTSLDPDDTRKRVKRALERCFCDSVCQKNPRTGDKKMAMARQFKITFGKPKKAVKRPRRQPATVA
jgi:hypothetical protein